MLIEASHRKEFLRLPALTPSARALIDAAILGDDDSNEMYKAALQDRIDSNLTGNHTARHKYVKVKGRRGLGDGKYS